MKKSDDEISCLFNVSYSNSNESQSRSSPQDPEVLKIKRSNSYIYDIDDSVEDSNDVDSWPNFMQIASMPDLLNEAVYEDNKLDRITSRCSSAAPNFYNFAFRDRKSSQVDLSLFIKDNAGLYDSLKQSQNHSTSKNDESPEMPDPAHIRSPSIGIGTENIANDCSCLISNTKIFTSAGVGAFCQSSPYEIDLEMLVIPMINDCSRIELRIPYVKLDPEKRKALKRIAVEHDLILLNIGKAGSKCIILRKKASLIQKQTAEREALKLAEQERQRMTESAQTVIGTEVETEQMPALCYASIQTYTQETQGNGPTRASNSVPENTHMNAAARRKARRAAERKQKAREAAAIRARERKKRDSAMQTCPQDWLLCPWCTKDIPPAEQVGHVGLCRAAVRQQDREAKAKAQLESYRLAAENARRRKQNLPPILNLQGVEHNQAPGRERKHSRSLSKHRSSRSRTRSADAKLTAAQKRQAAIEAQLREIHPNDVNGMLQATQRVCSHANCPHIITASGGVCGHCRLVFCPQHRPPHSGHACPAAPSLKSGAAAVENGNKQPSMDEKMQEERQAILKQRLRERISNLAERRRR